MQGEIFNAPLDAIFLDFNMVQPDLLFTGKQKQIIKDTRFDGAPALVIEIMSPPNTRMDRLQKFRIYQAAKIQHYWLVNPEEKTFEFFTLQKSPNYTQPQIMTTRSAGGLL